MATGPIRWACAQQLIEILRAEPALDGVQIEPGFPGDVGTRREAIWLDAMTGTVTARVMTPDRRMLDDNFVMPLQLRVAGHRTLDGAMARISELLHAAYQPIVTGVSTLQGLDGVVSALPGELNGPTAGETPSDGVLAFASLTVDVHARIE